MSVMSHAGYVAPGSVLLGKYRVDRVLGTGGMAVVVAATHLHLQERVAIKLLLPEVLSKREVVRRFLREAQATVRLKDEHVARVAGVGTLPDGIPYIVMEYLDGQDLRVTMSERGALPPGEVVDYLLQACEALAEAHALGIVHRDVKPANLFLSRRPDGSPLLKVLDFGISKMPVTVDNSWLTRSQVMLGTPSYMSPEQMRCSRDVDGRTDIWSLGVVLYELLAGRRPFEAESFSALCFKVGMDPVPPLPVLVPKGLDQIVYRCLEKESAARFPTVAALAAAMAPYAATPRAANVVVERTQAMLGGVVSRAAMATTDVAGSSPTTLDNSAAELGPRRRRRGLLVAGTTVATLALVSLLVVMVDGRGSGAGIDAAIAPRAASSDREAAKVPIVDAATPPSPDATASALVQDAGPAASPTSTDPKQADSTGKGAASSPNSGPPRRRKMSKPDQPQDKPPRVKRVVDL